MIGWTLFWIALLGMAPILIATRSYSGSTQLLFVLCFIGFLALANGIAIRSLFRGFYRSKKFRELYRSMFVQSIAEAFSMSAVKAPTYFRDIKQRILDHKLDFRNGFLAMPVDDTDWQQVVHEAIDHADAILIDVTELSVNLEWELNEIAKRCKLERVVLAFGFSMEFDSSEGWQRHPSSASLDRIFGAQWRNCCQKFCYPQRIDHKMKEQIKERMHQLAMRIYEAIVA